MGNISRMLWVPVIFAVLYTSWIMWQRHVQDSQPAKPAIAQPDPLAGYGKDVKILQLYTTTGQIAPGEKALLCYGVLNATAVQLDPPVEKVWPSLSRCFDVHPAKTTRYALTAEGADHETVSESIEIVVAR